jgi:hypothetical protein
MGKALPVDGGEHRRRFGFAHSVAGLSGAGGTLTS